MPVMHDQGIFPHTNSLTDTSEFHQMDRVLIPFHSIKFFAPDTDLRSKTRILQHQAVIQQLIQPG